MGIFIIGFYIIWRTVHSPFGQVLQALRENEPRAISLGYDVDRFKLLAFVLSAAIAGRPAPPRRWCSCRRRCPTPPGRCRAWSS